MECNKYRICLHGVSLDAGNQGCRALTISLVRLALISHPDSHISLLYGNKEGGVRTITVEGKTCEAELINFRLSPKAHLTEHLFFILFCAILYSLLPSEYLRKKIQTSVPWIDAVFKADFVGDIRGGDSFSDFYGFRRLFIGSIPVYIALLLGKRPVLLPQTYGPFRNMLSRKIAQSLFSKSGRIYARDMESYDLASKLAGKNRSMVFLCPDVAFALESELPCRVPLDRPYKKPAELLGINVSGLLYRGGYNRNNMFGLASDYGESIRCLIHKFLDLTDAHILLIPHVFESGIEDDLECCIEIKRGVPSEFSDRISTVTGEISGAAIKTLIGECDFFIGSRMHSCIAALSQCIPSAAIAYSSKFHGIYELAGIEENVLDARICPSEEIIEKCLILYEKRNQAKQVLGENIPGVIKGLFRISQDMFESSGRINVSG